VILVTGMHRSGTSLVAMTMEALGVSFGDHAEFYAADEWNAKGYFERRDVMDINSRMITGLPRTESKVASLAGQAVYLSEPSIDKVLGRGIQFAEQIDSVVDSIGAGAVKDPRFCLTWPAWRRRVEIEACVVCVRHPFEVADSLWRRQRIPLGIGLRFWRYHIRALRENTPRGMIVVDLDSLKQEPRVELEMLVESLGLDLDPEDAVRRFHAMYSADMVRTTSREERPSLDPETNALLGWLAEHRAIPTLGR
jgi:hypothetical protein